MHQILVIRGPSRGRKRPMQASEGGRKGSSRMDGRRYRHTHFVRVSPCHSFHLGFSSDFAYISNSRRFKRQKHFDPFILRIDHFPGCRNIQQMYSKDGFVTRLLFAALQMCVANYITTCGCTDGNISAPAGAPTKTRRCLATVVTGFGGRGGEWLGLFSLFGFQIIARIDRGCSCLKIFP